MLESIFIILLIIGIIIFLLGVADDAVAYYGISLIIFLVLAGEAFNVSVPYIIATSTTNFTKGSHVYQEYGLSALCSIFIFVDLIMLILHWFHKRRMKRGDVPYVPPGMR